MTSSTLLFILIVYTSRFQSGFRNLWKNRNKFRSRKSLIRKKLSKFVLSIKIFQGLSLLIKLMLIAISGTMISLKLISSTLLKLFITKFLKDSEGMRRSWQPFSSQKSPIQTCPGDVCLEWMIKRT